MAILDRRRKEGNAYLTHVIQPFALMGGLHRCAAKTTASCQSHLGSKLWRRTLPRKRPGSTTTQALFPPPSPGCPRFYRRRSLQASTKQSTSLWTNWQRSPKFRMRCRQPSLRLYCIHPMSSETVVGYCNLIEVHRPMIHPRNIFAYLSPFQSLLTEHCILSLTDT